MKIGKVSYMIDFNKSPACYWDMIEQVSWLQRRIIIHSILYYELDNSIISDTKFDQLSQQLVEMQSEILKYEFRKTRYYYCMKDFDGSTGYYLYSRLNTKDKEYLMNIAQQVLRSKENA